jgi:hypothetical protein
MYLAQLVYIISYTLVTFYIVNILPSASFSLVFNAMEELKDQAQGRPCLFECEYKRKELQISRVSRPFPLLLEFR